MVVGPKQARTKEVEVVCVLAGVAQVHDTRSRSDNKTEYSIGSKRGGWRFTMPSPLRPLCLLYNRPPSLPSSYVMNMFE